MKKTQFFKVFLIATTLCLSANQTITGQDLYKAVCSEKVEEIKAHLAKGADPNFKSQKMTLLTIAIKADNPEVAKLMINAKGVKVNEYSYAPMGAYTYKYTALITAVHNSELVKLLLEKGAMIDMVDEHVMWDGKMGEGGGNTALMMAMSNSKKPYIETAKILIDKGAKLNLKNRQGNTALIMSAYNAEISKILIDKGANLDLQNNGGETALMYAAFQNPEVVKLLLDKGANFIIRQGPHRASPNALDYAAKHGNIESAKLILAKATEKGVKEEVISGGMFWAVGANQLAMAKYLLDEGANIEGTDADGNYTPLMQTANLAMVEMLVKRGANVNAVSKFNTTPLNKAVFNFQDPDNKEKDCEKIMKLLLDKGANVNTQDGNGNSVLMSAVAKEIPTKMIIDKGADINVKNKNGETALMLAVKGGFLKKVIVMPIVGPYKDAVKLLLAKGADVNAQENNGKTALMHAAGAANAIGDKYSAYTEMAELLIAKGANVNAEDKDKNTALYWAQRYNRTKTAEMLIAKGANPAKKYVRSEDKSNVKAGIVGTWENVTKAGTVSIVTRVVFKADWTYSKTMISGGQTVPDGGKYNTYDLRDGRIWVFNNIPTSEVYEFRFEGKTLILNGSKFTKK